uniref:Uncharacterized protein n=1 Tax=Rhodnius prolixus TaxID=13249 RepID=T1HU40_RHOPR
MSLKRKWLTLEEKINVLEDFAKTKSSHRQLAER